MKKKALSLLLALLMLVSVSLSLAVSVSANDGDDSLINVLTGSVGSYANWVLNERSNHGVVRLTETVWGSYPPGMNVNVTADGRFLLEGTPTQAGYWRITQCAEVYDPSNPSVTWEEAYDIRVTIEGTSQPPVITKHPTGETVAESGWTEFIAYADGAKYIRWQLVNQSSWQTINAADAPTYFPGVKVTGADSSALIFENVPLSMDNWAAQCVFTNDYGEVTTSAALIRVQKTELKLPEIKTQSQDTELVYGANVTLTVDAVSPDGNVLMYQWYKNVEPSRNGGDAIYGAYGASFTVSYELGTNYYYCVIRNSKGSETSTPVATELITVTGLPAPTATPAPTEAPTATPVPTEAPTAAPVPTAAPQAPVQNNNSALIVVLSAAVAALAVALVIVLATRKKH